MEDDIIRTRAKRKKLRVTFPNGEVICYSSVAATMVETLNRIGAEKFPLIKLEVNYLPLISKEIYPKYEKYMKPLCDGWYLNTQPNTDSKFILLKAINEQLSLGLNIELSEDFEVQEEPKKEKRTKSKGIMRVKLPNGEEIVNSRTTQIFLQVIKYIGIENIKSKHLLWGGNPLITNTQIVNNQVQIDSNRWIIIPNTTKEKAKLLRVIGAMLHVNMEIDISK